MRAVYALYLAAIVGPLGLAANVKALALIGGALVLASAAMAGRAREPLFESVTFRGGLYGSEPTWFKPATVAGLVVIGSGWIALALIC